MRTTIVRGCLATSVAALLLQRCHRAGHLRHLGGATVVGPVEDRDAAVGAGPDPGRHEPLIEPDLFDRVQKVLYSERGAGTRQRVHQHYLKGTVWCDRCKRRLILRPSTSKTGRLYFYYICRGVQEKDCDLPALPVWKVERAVEAHYVHVEVSQADRATMEHLMKDAVLDGKETSSQLRAQLVRRLGELDKQQDRYLDLIGDADWPQDKIKARLRQTREEQLRIQRQLDDTSNELDTGRHVLLVGLELLGHPQELYRLAKDRARKVLNQAIFSRLYLDYDGEAAYVASDEMTEPFTTIVYARRESSLTSLAEAVDEAMECRSAISLVEDTASSELSLADLLCTALAGQGASKAAMVELRGFDSLTPSMRRR